MEESVTAELPTSLDHYFAAQNDHDAERMAICFAPDATVRDEGRNIIGRDAIRDWKLETIAKYGVGIQPIDATAEGPSVTVIAKVTGNFPGSPVELTYDFKLDEAGLIHRLEIH
jgi:hypothetical protein